MLFQSYARMKLVLASLKEVSAAVAQNIGNAESFRKYPAKFFVRESVSF